MLYVSRQGTKSERHSWGLINSNLEFSMLPYCYGMDIPGAFNDGKGQCKGRKMMYSLWEAAS
jgi:hypothetical protein